MRINREQLLKQLVAVEAGLSKKEVTEQSNCFVFKDGKVMTYNDEVACTTECVVEIEGAVAADPLRSLLEKLPEDDVDIDVNATELLIKGKRRRAGVRLEAEVLLPIDAVETPKKWRPLPEEFTEAVGIAQQCVSRDESQFTLTCVHIHPDWVEACDNFRATRYPMETGVKKPTLVRQEAIRHIQGLDMQEVSETKGWIHFRNGGGLVLSCRRYMEEYPDLKNILTVNGEKTTLPKGLAEAADKAQVFSGDSGDDNVVKVTLKKDRVKIRGEGTRGWYEEQAKASYEGSELAFLISPKLLVEITRRTNECEVTEGCLKIDGGKFSYVSCLGAVEDD